MKHVQFVPWTGALVALGLGVVFLATNLMQGPSRGLSPEARISKELNTSTFQQALSTAELAVVDFYADWCGPCHQLAPIYEQLAGAYKGRIQFFKVDIQANPELGESFASDGIPCLWLFKQGKPLERKLGLRSRRIYERWFNQALQQSSSASST